MEDAVPKPPNEDTPAQVPRDRGCVCRHCGVPMRCDLGAVVDHRFICHTCRDTPSKVGRR